MSVTTMETKIAKLLTAAEGAATEAEAQSFFAKAQTLATAHSISLAQARMVAEAGQKREEPTHERITIGKKGKHTNKHIINLYVAVAEVNDLKITIAHNSTFINLYGMPSDIALTKSLTASLAVQMVRFGDEFIREGSWRDEQVWRCKKNYVEYDESRYDYRTRRMVQGYWEESWGYYKPTAQSTRASFYESFISTLSARLHTARREAVKTAEAQEAHFHAQTAPEGGLDSAPGQALSSVALALVSKKEEVTKFYVKASGNPRGSWSGGGRGGHRHSGASDAGRAAAKRANIGGGKSIGGGGRAIGG